MKKGVLLVNLGTPDSPSVADVRKYLREFLMDERVIDIPFLQRWLLIHLIIATFRAPNSAREYQKLWDERGSPLKYLGEDLTQLVQQKLGDEYITVLGMRYQNPSIEHALGLLKKQSVSEIIVIPLFPQYASASTGSVIQKVNELVNQWQVIPSIRFVSKFSDHPGFIQSFVSKGKKMLEAKKYDYVIFSYHGLPERQITKASHGFCQINDKCCTTYHPKNQYCYRAQCYRTTKLLAEGLSLDDSQYTTTFQSRLGKTPWIRPYTDEVLLQLPKKGITKVLAFSPAFIADCLETTIEVGQTFRDDFLAAGGETWDLVPSLNTSETWVNTIVDFVKQ